MANPEIDNYTQTMTVGSVTFSPAREGTPVPYKSETVSNGFHGLTKAPLTYLAVPYSYKSPDKRIQDLVQKFRFETATRAAGYLLSKHGWNVFSPITHSHPIHINYPEVRGDWEFWKQIDTEYLQISARIVVLTLPGWKKSTGVTAEIEIARRFGLAFSYLHPEGDSFKMSRSPQDFCHITVDLV